MTQADSVLSTPPINTSAELPTPSQETLTARLVAEAKKRRRAVKRLRKLRIKAADEIERLLAFLDAVDDTDVDSAVDDLGCDAPDEGNDEPSLGWTEQEARWGRHAWSAYIDAELDNCDDEPSLGSHVLPSGAVSYFIPVCRDGSLDCEGDEHDGREPGEDDEPSLCGIHADCKGCGKDLEADLGSFDRMMDQTKSTHHHGNGWLVEGGEIDSTL